ncbi:MFS transporter [Levilactobacillus mulengensis]|uniref:hypothetical protein n=1 Tax=Levilactobacillus mulengensis TaxID=2486025 RepID=UPI000F77A69C|nr:hypothetical protein [Levilactobacillus mulengensis]
MRNILKNRAVLTLSTANIAETIGVSLFNIILLMYAKQMAQPTLMVSIVSISVIIPGTLGILTGRLADFSRNKARALIYAKLVQSGLYVLLGCVITRKTLWVFGVVIAVDIISHCLGQYSSSLRLPIIKEKVPKGERQQVLGLNQSIASLLQPVGQSLGITVIALSHDYAIAAFINAGTFLVAALILKLDQNRLVVKTTEMTSASS